MKLLAAEASVPEVPHNVRRPPVDVHRTPSGLCYLVLQAGAGRRYPTADDQVEVHYSGWTVDGKLFDSTVARGRPLVLRPRHLIVGLAESLTLMVEGESTRFWIPAALGYGESSGGGDMPRGMLVFDVDLLRIF